MKITPLAIQGTWLVESPVWKDNRGSFHEWFKRDELMDLTGIDFTVAQANFSESSFGVIRGIHYSLDDEGQSKWITCLDGSINDVVIDLRRSSPTFGKSISNSLGKNDGRALLIGPGLGHGFASLATTSKVAYLVNTNYVPTCEYEINPLDPNLGIDWGIDKLSSVRSNKDLIAPTLAERLAEGKLPK